MREGNLALRTKPKRAAEDVRKKVTDVTMTQEEINKEVKDLWSEVMKQSGEAKVHHEEEMKTMQVLLRGTATRERKRVMEETERLRREAQEEVAVAFDRIKTLQSNLTDKTAEASVWKRTATTKEEQATSLQSQLTALDDLSAKHRTERDAAHDTIAVLRSELTALHEANDDNKNSRLKLIAADAELCNLRVKMTEESLIHQEQLTTLRVRVSAAESAATASKQTQQDLSQALEKQKLAGTTSQRGLDNLQREHLALQSQVAALKASLGQSEGENASTTANLSSINTDLAAVKARADEREAEMEKLQSMNSQLQASFDTANGRIQTLLGDLDASHAVVTELRAQVAEKQQNTSSLEADLAALRGSLGGMEELRERHTGRVKGLEEQVKHLKDECSGQSGMLQELQQQQDMSNTRRLRQVEAAVGAMRVSSEMLLLRGYFEHLRGETLRLRAVRHERRAAAQRKSLSRLLAEKNSECTLRQHWVLLAQRRTEALGSSYTLTIARLEEEMLKKAETQALLEEEVSKLEAEVMFQSSLGESSQAVQAVDEKHEEELYALQVQRQSAEFLASRTKRKLAAELCKRVTAGVYHRAWRSLIGVAHIKRTARLKAEVLLKTDECVKQQKQFISAGCNITELEVRCSTLQSVADIRKQQVADMTRYGKGLALRVQKHDGLMASRRKALCEVLTTVSRVIVLHKHFRHLVVNRAHNLQKRATGRTSTRKTDDLERRLTELVNQLEAERKARVEDTAKMDNLRKQLNETAKAEGDVSVMNSEIYILKEQLRAVQDEVVETRQENHRVVSNSEAYERQVDDLFTEMEGLRAVVGDKEEELRHARVERDRCSKMLDEVRREKDEEVAQLMRRVGGLVDVEGDAVGLRGVLDTREQEISFLRSEMTTSQGRISELQSSLDQAMVLVNEHSYTASRLSEDLRTSQQQATLSDTRLRSLTNKQYAAERFVRASIGVLSDRVVYHKYLKKLKLYLRKKRRERCMPAFAAINVQKVLAPMYAKLQKHANTKRCLRRRGALCSVPAPHLRVMSRYWLTWAVWVERRRVTDLNTQNTAAVREAVAAKEDAIKAAHHDVLELKKEIPSYKSRISELEVEVGNTDDLKAGLMEEIDRLNNVLKEQKDQLYQASVKYHDLETSNAMERRVGCTKRAAVLRGVTVHTTLRRHYLCWKRWVQWQQFFEYEKRCKQTSTALDSVRAERDALSVKVKENNAHIEELEYELKVFASNQETQASLRREKGRRNKVLDLQRATELALMRKVYWRLSANVILQQERQRTRLASELGQRGHSAAASTTRAVLRHTHHASTYALHNEQKRHLLRRYYHALTHLPSRCRVKQVQKIAAGGSSTFAALLLLRAYYNKLLASPLKGTKKRALQVIATEGLKVSSHRCLVAKYFNCLLLFPRVQRAAYHAAALEAYNEEKDMVVTKSHTNLVFTRFNAISISSRLTCHLLLKRYMKALHLHRQRRALLRTTTVQLAASSLSTFVHRYYTVWTVWLQLNRVNKNKKELVALREQVTQLQGTKADLEKQLTQSAEAKASLEASGEELLHDYTVVNSELTRTREELEGKQHECERQARLSADLRDTVAARETDVDALKGDVSKLEKVLRKRKQKERDLSDDLAALRAEYAVLQNDNTNLLERRREAAKNEMHTAVKMLEMQRQISTFEEDAVRAAQLQNDHQALASDASGLRQGVADLTEQNENLKQSLQGTVNSLEELKYSSGVAEEALSAKLTAMKGSQNHAVSVHLLHLNEMRMRHKCWMQLVLLKNESRAQRAARDNSSDTAQRAVLVMLQMRQHRLLTYYYGRMSLYMQRKRHRQQLDQFEQSLQSEKREKEILNKQSESALKEAMSLAFGRTLSTQLLKMAFKRLQVNVKWQKKRLLLVDRAAELEVRNTKVHLHRIYTAFSLHRLQKLRLKKLLSNCTGLHNLVAHDLMGGYLRRLRVYAVTTRAARDAAALCEAHGSAVDEMTEQHSALASKLEEELAAAMAKGSYFEGKFVEEEERHKRAKADLKELHEKAAGLEKRATAAEEHIADLRGKLNEALEEKATTEGRMKKWQRSHEELSKETTAARRVLEDKVAEQETALQRKATDLRACRDEIEALTVSLMAKEADCKRLGTKNTALHEELSAGKSNYEADRKEMERRVSDARESNRKLKLESEQCKENLLKDVDDLTQRLETSTTTLQGAREELKEATKTEVSLSGQLKEANHQTMQLAEQIEVTLTTTSENVKVMEQRVRDLEAANDNLEVELNNAKLDVTEKGERISLLEGRLSQNTEQNQALEADLFKLRTDNSALEASGEVVGKNLKEAQEAVVKGKVKVGGLEEELNVTLEELLAANELVEEGEQALVRSARKVKDLEEDLEKMKEMLEQKRVVEKVRDEEMAELRKEAEDALAEQINLEQSTMDEVENVKQEMRREVEAAVQEKNETLEKIKNISMLATNAAEELAFAGQKTAQMEAELQTALQKTQELESRNLILREEKRAFTEERVLQREKLLQAEESISYLEGSKAPRPLTIKQPEVGSEISNESTPLREVTAKYLEDSQNSTDTSRLLSPPGDHLEPRDS